MDKHSNTLKAIDILNNGATGCRIHISTEQKKISS